MKDCNSCGKCCIKYSNGALSASSKDLELWESYRPEIHNYVNNGKIWTDPKTAQQIELCPWLRENTNQESEQTQYTCEIYSDRPEDCRVYPSNVNEMLLDDCEMLEKKDIANLKLAQINLETKFKND